VIYHQPESADLGTFAATNSEVGVEKCCMIGRQTIAKDHM
jgi:hypothetical protein